MRIVCNRRHAIRSVCTAVGLVMIGMLSGAAADTIDINEKFGGTFDTATQIDVNADGLQASIGSSEQLDATLGNSSCTGITEEVATDPTAECPGGVFIIDAANGVGYSTGTCTFPNGDQLYINILTRTDCFDLTGVFVSEDTAEITGGTGQFAGATGTFEQTFTGFFQIFDPESGQGFGSFTGVATGTLDAPNLDLDGGGGDGIMPDCNGDGTVDGLDLIGAGC